MHKILFFNRINVRILSVLLVLFAVVFTVAGQINQHNIRRMYEQNYTERVLINNTLMSTYLENEDVSYFVDLMKNQDDGFKQMQVDFCYARQELYQMQEEGASEEQQRDIMAQLKAFYEEMEVHKNDRYWNIINELWFLQESSHSTYVYVIADTGLTTENGEMIYTYIFDASDNGTFSDSDTDGLGTCAIADSSDLESIKFIYDNKIPMDYVEYYNGEYGELYFAYAPILDDDGNVIAVLGTDLDLEDMYREIASSALRFNIVFLVLFTIILLFTFVLLSHSIIKPLHSLTATSREIIAGNLSAVVSETALKQRSEMGILAHTIKEAIEAVEAANKAKSAFLANMSHEIRTPMNAILGITEIQLQNGGSEADRIEALEKIYDSSNLLLNIINDILDLSKIEAGKLEIIPVEYDVPSLINDTVQLNRLRYDSKPIDFHLDVDENTPLSLIGDELRIKQILSNILSNAFKYTEKGEINLSVWPENDVYIVFKVSDTGQGMTQEQLSSLFDEYTRFNMEANRTTVGTGLGMSITKRLLNMMGGEIWVESEEYEGSVFTVRIPQKRVDQRVCGNELIEKLRNFRFQSTTISKKSSILRDYMPYGSVLVVDDVSSNIYVAKGMLIPYGLQVETANSGYEAIAKINSGKEYDIIFMDHMMPGMDGVEATEIIRSTGYSGTIIALTANAIVGEAEKFMQKGFDGYISKPIDSRELDAALNNYIRNKKPPEIVRAARYELDTSKTRETLVSAKNAEEDTADDIVSFFLIDAENTVNVLEGICAKEDNLDEEDIMTFEIAVHGIKNAFANIGETELSDFAYELEQAAINKDIAVITDKTAAFITALKALTEKLRLADKGGGASVRYHEATLENILNSINAFISVTVPETGEILFINKRMQELYGLKDDGTGRICYELFRDYDKMCEFCPQSKLDKEPDKIIVWDEYMENLGRHMRHSDSYIDWPDGSKVHLQCAEDITDLVVANRQANEASNAKSAFLAKMSHEIRTPMNAIIGMSELALRDETMDTVKEHVVTIRHAGKNLMAIINDILDFSKIEAGKMEIIADEYSISSLINDVVSIIRMRVEDAEIRFAVIADKNIPSILYGDETRIRQAVLNILGNAIKYTEKGFVTLGIYSEFVNDNDAKDGKGIVNLVFEVTDSGIGIKAEDMKKLFTDFTQFDLERNRGVEGVGLGLAITHSIVNAMGGNITVASEYGKGSVFTITLPQEYHAYEPIAAVKNMEDKRIIVYERREIYAQSIAYSMDNLGVDYTLVTSEAELYEDMETQVYNYLFISYTLFKKNEDTIYKFGKDIQIVILAEFGETIHEKNVSVLAMPIYCTHIADVLNGSHRKSSYSTAGESVVKFSAPDASILVVDDIQTNLKVTEGLLKPYNMRVDLCGGGAASIKAVQAERYDLVFMDHRMPGVDGVEAVRRIREMGERYPYYKELPIIALTANAISGMQEMYLESGFNDFLSKPIVMGELNAILEKWIPQEKREIA